MPRVSRAHVMQGCAAVDATALSSLLPAQLGNGPCILEMETRLHGYPRWHGRAKWYIHISRTILRRRVPGLKLDQSISYATLCCVPQQNAYDKSLKICSVPKPSNDCPLNILSQRSAHEVADRCAMASSEVV